jgi:hypothetical protein
MTMESLSVPAHRVIARLDQLGVVIGAHLRHTRPRAAFLNQRLRPSESLKDV